MDPLKMYFLLKIVIFDCYVSLPEGKSWPSFSCTEIQKKEQQTTFRFSLTKKKKNKLNNEPKELLLFSLFFSRIKKQQFPHSSGGVNSMPKKTCSLLPKVLVLGHLHLGLKPWQQPVQGLAGRWWWLQHSVSHRILCVQTFQKVIPFLKKTASLQVCTGKWMVGRWSGSF